MNEEGKQPQQMPHQIDVGRYKKLFGLEIYLTPVFVISSITIVAFIIGTLIYINLQERNFKNTLPEKLQVKLQETLQERNLQENELQESELIELRVEIESELRSSLPILFNGARKWLTTNLDWLFMISTNLVFLFCLYVALSPFGKIRLGGVDAKPDYSYITWLAMLFAAGIGIGLLFFGVSEPMEYLQRPPLGMEAGTVDAANMGIATTVFHWGLQGWAIYGIVGLALAFFAYNRGLPLLIRSAFYPIFGDRIWGWTGHIIDTFAIFAGIFGLATSLGLGVQQVTAGMDYLYGIPANNLTMILLIVVITSIALISVITGINVGIKRLSQFNVILAFILLLAVFLLGPTLYIFRSIFTGLGTYIMKIVPLSNWIGREDTDFYHGWTTFYWAWWIAWAPFIGTFIARISKGRTIREFIVFVLIIPTLLCLLWFSAFGGTALHQNLVDGYTAVADKVAVYDYPIALFKMLDELPLAILLGSIAMLLTIIFFVTSSDSGSLIIDIIAAGGKVDAPVPQRVFWCTVEGLVAIALLLGGGLKSLQAASLMTGFPFAIVLLGMGACVYVGLRDEKRKNQSEGQP